MHTVVPIASLKRSYGAYSGEIQNNVVLLRK